MSERCCDVELRHIFPAGDRRLLATTSTKPRRITISGREQRIKASVGIEVYLAGDILI